MARKDVHPVEIQPGLHPELASYRDNLLRTWTKGFFQGDVTAGEASLGLLQRKQILDSAFTALSAFYGDLPQDSLWRSALAATLDVENHPVARWENDYWLANFQRVESSLFDGEFAPHDAEKSDMATAGYALAINILTDCFFSDSMNGDDTFRYYRTDDSRRSAVVFGDKGAPHAISFERTMNEAYEEVGLHVRLVPTTTYIDRDGEPLVGRRSNESFIDGHDPDEVVRRPRRIWPPRRWIRQPGR